MVSPFFGPKNQRGLLTDLTNKFTDVFEDRGDTVNVPRDQWMSVVLKSDAVPDPHKVYPVGPKDREVIDEVHDQLHAQGKMEWTTHPTPYQSPVFVVWRTVTVDGKPIRKGRVVVDVRGLNKKIIPENYPVPLQSDIISAVRGHPYISILDGVKMLHQFLTDEETRHLFTVGTHRGQERYNVVVMGFNGSVAYVQRQVDNLTRDLRAFVRAYIDDLVVFSMTLEEHLDHLRQLLELLRSVRLAISPEKSFLGFPTIRLLGQRVDAFGLATCEEKMKAITNLKYPHSLRELERYLGMTGWLRDYVPYYAQLSEALQILKTRLLKDTPSHEGGARKRYAATTKLPHPTGVERVSFDELQKVFARGAFLVHFQQEKTLVYDLDASKSWGFGVMIYHLKEPPATGITKFTKGSIEPIMFLSKALTTAESKYWPTEMEVACLVWAIKKTRHMVEAAQQPTIIVTDHSSTVSIAQQTKLSTGSTDRANLRLVRAGMYLSQFSLDIRHRPGKEHIVPDALSRLAGVRAVEDPEASALDVDSYFTTLVEMSDDFRARLLQAYEGDVGWKAVKESVTAQSRGDRPITVPFAAVDDLLYFKDPETHRLRLCIPRSLAKEVFELAHDQVNHSGFNTTYARVVETIYMFSLSRLLKRYIAHCPECQHNQTRRHPPYGDLRPVESPAVPFHTITMDFILAMPTVQSGFDCILTVTEKFCKRILLVAGKKTWDAKAWARALLKHLHLADWGIPSAIVSDRDPKFMADFWEELFMRLGTNLLTSTAYHPQTDGQSERTNQTVEIALRYLITGKPGVNWLDALPAMQSAFNNQKSASTGRSPNEILYGFNIRGTLGLLGPLPHLDHEVARQMHQRDARDSVAFANARAKAYFDGRHRLVRFVEGDQVLLRLHKGYQLPGEHNPKLSRRYAGPFTVKRMISQGAYELDLPEDWRVHPVITTEQLEPLPDEPDPYGRHRPWHPDAVETASELTYDYEVVEIKDRRLRRYGRRPVWEYLVRYQGFEDEHNEWKAEHQLQNHEQMLIDYDGRHPRPPRQTYRDIHQPLTQPELNVQNRPIREVRPTRRLLEAQEQQQQARPSRRRAVNAVETANEPTNQDDVHLGEVVAKIDRLSQKHFTDGDISEVTHISHLNKTQHPDLFNISPNPHLSDPIPNRSKEPSSLQVKQKKGSRVTQLN